MVYIAGLQVFIVRFSFRGARKGEPIRMMVGAGFVRGSANHLRRLCMIRSCYSTNCVSSQQHLKRKGL